MSQAVQHAHSTADTRSGEHRATGWVGWISFASVIMVLAGIFQVMAGLIAIFRSAFYSVSSNQLIIFQSIRSWGWVNLIMGIILVLAGLSLLSGAFWARTLAVLLAGLSAIAYLASIALYPVWSVIGITIAVLVIYAVIVHGREVRNFNY